MKVTTSDIAASRGTRDSARKAASCVMLCAALCAALCATLSSCETARVKDSVTAFGVGAHGSIVIAVEPAIADCGLFSAQIARDADRMLPVLLRSRGYSLTPTGAEGEVALALRPRLVQREFDSGVRTLNSIDVELEFYPAAAPKEPGSLVLLVRKITESENGLSSSYLLSDILENCVAMAAAEIDKSRVTATVK